MGNFKSWCSVPHGAVVLFEIIYDNVHYAVAVKDTLYQHETVVLRMSAAPKPSPFSTCGGQLAACYA
jgi:hypothetical protein